MTLLQELRSSTAEAHVQLEKHLDLPSRMRDREQYAAVLTGLRSAYDAWESAVTAAPATSSTLPDWPSRTRKVRWLDEDLAALAVPIASPRVPVPAVSTVEEILGCVYVMEGATLGGAVLERELAALPAPPPHRFFTGYAERRGRMWRTFRQRTAELDDTGTDGTPLDAELAVRAARRTFAGMEHACLSALSGAGAR